MTYQEILNVLISEEVSSDEFAYGYFNKTHPVLGTIIEIDQYGGEGQGDTWYSVKHFVDHDVYIKIDGWYSSYMGTEFKGLEHCCREVRPVEKIVTVYE